jgi:hypothetical protein
MHFEEGLPRNVSGSGSDIARTLMQVAHDWNLDSIIIGHSHSVRLTSSMPIACSATAMRWLTWPDEDSGATCRN